MATPNGVPNFSQFGSIPTFSPSFPTASFNAPAQPTDPNQSSSPVPQFDSQVQQPVQSEPRYSYSDTSSSGSSSSSNDSNGNGTTSESSLEPGFAFRLQRALSLKYQQLLDQSAPFLILRWVGLVVAVLLYCIRVYYVQGFYIVTYGLGIFLLNLFIGFLTPLDDSEGDGPLLPTHSDGDEFKPFIRRLPEFKFWHSCSKAIVIGFWMTFFSVFDIPVFWPILLIYFIILFVLTMKRQIKHMIQHKYIPFSFGKKRYNKPRVRKEEDIQTK